MQFGVAEPSSGKTHTREKSRSLIGRQPQAKMIHAADEWVVLYSSKQSVKQTSFWLGEFHGGWQRQPQSASALFF